MAKKCDICGKGPIFGNNVSHAHNKNRKKWLPNIQKVNLKRNGQKSTIKVCTSCIRSGKTIQSAS